MSRSVVFLCTGNACRSQMAEGFARRLLPADVAVYSAGTSPTRLDPRSVEAMAELGIDIAGQRSKSITNVPLADASLVITLCGDAADACPATPAVLTAAASPAAASPGATSPAAASPAAASPAAALPAAALPGPASPNAAVEHWPLTDPASAIGAGESARSAFRAVRDEVLRRVLALAARIRPEPALGVIGGSGFYALPGLSDLRPVEVDTPFGPPSAALRVGRLGDRRVVFLARHGDTHHLLPSEINTRANVYALKRLGVTKVISVSAVGSLREEIEPGHVALPRQFIDRTAGRPQTFFGRGVVAHVSLADPVCGGAANALAAAARRVSRYTTAKPTYASRGHSSRPGPSRRCGGVGERT